MPKYLVQRVWEFMRGEIDGATEAWPPELVDKDGRRMRRLGQWPKEPLEVEAPDEDVALWKAQRAFAEAGSTIHVRDGVGVVQLRELRRRPRPGYPERSSVGVCWIGKEETAPADQWHRWTVEEDKLFK